MRRWFLALAFLPFTVFAELLEIPIFDSSSPLPSMSQSLHFSSSFYQAAHVGLDLALIEKGTSLGWRRMATIGVDFLSFYLPLGNAWMHEEWHRAVLSHRGIGSYNGVYDLKLFVDSIPVSHVTDEDLVRLKRDHPADMVRLSSAGIEAETEQNLYLEKQSFFRESKSWNLMILWSNAAQNFFYVEGCNRGTSTELTQRMQNEEGTNISQRDFTGLDCLGWVYDLFRPDEPYQNRGAHPSGVGIRRYRTLEDLTDKEKDFLRRQEYLQLLNFVDPFLFERSFYMGKNSEAQSFYWNWKLQHFMTSFGYQVDLVLMYKDDSKKLLLKLNNGFNDTRYFPGVSIELVDQPLADKFEFSSLFAMWSQPKNQRLDAVDGQLGGLFRGAVSYRMTEDLRPALFLQVKNEGWVPGVVELESASSMGIGFQYLF